MRALWRRVVRLGFRLLYNELAWTYDVVSWLASRGLWRRWQRTALAYLPAEGRVLEVGFGPGHLLLDLAQGDGAPGAGRRQVFGLDLSPAMLRLARRRLASDGLGVSLVRGRAQELPFAAGTFDAVVLTFPTPFVYDRSWIEGLARLLRARGTAQEGAGRTGRLVVVEEARFGQRGVLSRFLEWLYGATGQRGPAPDLPARLEEAGFAAWRERVPVESTTVGLILAEKRAGA